MVFSSKTGPEKWSLKIVGSSDFGQSHCGGKREFRYSTIAPIGETFSLLGVREWCLPPVFTTNLNQLGLVGGYVCLCIVLPMDFSGGGSSIGS